MYTDAGFTGIGEAFGDDALMEHIVAKRIGPMAVNEDPLDIDTLWSRLFASRAFWEIGGSVLCAVSAIEVACWDIRGQAEGVPVHALLGGKDRNTVEGARFSGARRRLAGIHLASDRERRWS